MNLKDLKEWVNSVTEEDMEAFGEFTVIHAIWLEPDDGSDLVFRLDKPFIGITIDEQTEEVIFLTENMEPFINQN